MNTTTNGSIVRTRFAPSPSGHLHVGGARTALFCWAFARKHGGRFMLRIEDTDQKRSSDAASMAFLEDLKWLGIDWDEGPAFEGCGGGEAGPYFQSERLDIYNEHIERLIANGKAYRAFETSEELDASRERARKEGRAYRYDRAALKLEPKVVEQYLKDGRPHVVRFHVPENEEVIVRDEVLGEVRLAPGELDDFVIRKADGYPTYHFAVVVDDELMGVTHVLRAQEHLNNTPRHVVLQDALGFRRPVYAHLPLVFNPDNSKMSKRDKDKALRATVRERKLEAPPEGTVEADRWEWWLGSKDHQLQFDEAQRLAEALRITLPEINVDDFRRSGYLPEVLINYLALLGWSPGENIEKFDAKFLIERFDLSRIVKSAAKFDREKLLAFNLDAIQAMSMEEFTARFREHCRVHHPEFLSLLSDDEFALLASANKERSKTLEDPVLTCRFFVIADEAVEYEDAKPVRKALGGGPPSGLDHLTALLPMLETQVDFSAAALEATIKQYTDASADGQLGKVAQPLRVAVSGSTISPPIFDTLAILGKEKVVARIKRCLALHTVKT